MKPNVFLRVRVKELAHEARIIRLEERKTYRYGKMTTKTVTDRDGNTMTVKYRPVIGHDIKTHTELSEHRTGRLRRASRETILAYQFLRGIPYAAVEKPNSKPLTKDSIKAVERMCRKYGHTHMKWEDWIAGKNRVNETLVRTDIPDAPGAAA